MIVTNLTSPRSGAKVANQYTISDGLGWDYFQSYETLIAKINTDDKLLVVGDDYNYSNTTSRYFKQWLKDYYWNDEEIDNLKKMLSKAKLGDILYLTIGSIEYTIEYKEV